MAEKKAVQKFCTDIVARNIWLHMCRDFRVSEGENFGRKAELALLEKGITGLRGFQFPELGIISPGRYKRYQQLQNLLKKYRFAQDVYTDEELHELTCKKYIAEQVRLASKQPDTALRGMVVRRARKIARGILGSLNSEDIELACKFGSRSSIGCPLADAYLDVKLTDKRAFTGSVEGAAWFKNHILTKDWLMSEIVDKIGKPVDATFAAHETLTLVTVPKSWKTYRLITPLTLLDLFYSNGLGKVVQDRLAASKLDIRRLQQRHQGWMKEMSLSRSSATADLSAASDSLTRELLNQVLPRDWYCALKPLFRNQVLYKRSGETVQMYTESVLPMGNGATFPVETLVFYSIIRAIGELSGIKGRYSVYGDDLIYPSRLHRYVARIFPMLGLQLNLDKTFVGAPFRESCGSDFYRGCDVRSFYLQGEGAKLTRSKYAAFLYKTYNGLCRRWDPLEIPGTLRYVVLELLRVSDEILRIPPEYPDTAGIKTDTPSSRPLDLSEAYFSKIWLVADSGSYYYAFRFLEERTPYRYCVTALPYYWLSLQGKTDVPDGYAAFTSSAPIVSDAPRQSLLWRKQVRKRRYNFGGKVVLKRVIKWLPLSPSRTETVSVTSTGITSGWF